MSGFLLAAYIFVWPLLLPLVCVVAVACVPRKALAPVAALLALVILASALPLYLDLQRTPPPHTGLALAALAFYPYAAAALILPLAARLLLTRRRSRRR